MLSLPVARLGAARHGGRASASPCAERAAWGGRARRPALGLGDARDIGVDLAEEALARHDGWPPRPASEMRRPGFGCRAARAAQLTAAFELGRRLLADWPAGRWTVRSPTDVADRLILQMGRLEREELRAVLLNTKNVVLRVVTVYQGNVNSSLVRVGELFRDAVRVNATGIILVHNHRRATDPQSGRPASDGRGAGRRPAPRHRPLDHLVIGHVPTSACAIGRALRPSGGPRA